MGKRSDFDRVPRDYYPTPIEAVKPLIDHLDYSFDYVEPCAGDGRLISHIKELVVLARSSLLLLTHLGTGRYCTR